jgi:hypothetical protein
MIEKNDWRLQNQAKYLVGVTLVFGRYRQPSENWDHDHCEFCWATFADPEYRASQGYKTPEDVLKEGYHTQDEYRWICNSCFEDFQEMFKWKVVDV